MTHARGARSVETDAIVDDDVPATATIFAWIDEIYRQGVRRPGYPADMWTEDFCEAQLRRLGLANVRREPVRVARWEPTQWSLEAIPEGGSPVRLECFPLPHAAPTTGLDAQVAAYDVSDPDRVLGKASLYPVTLMRVPADMAARAGSAPGDASRRVVDRAGTLRDGTQVLPFGPELQRVMEPSLRAGAVAFIGVLRDYPGDSYHYYVPYDGVQRPIPGVWVGGRDGDWLTSRLAQGAMRVRLRVETTVEHVDSHNIVGELPGVDTETVLVGSHHDGPWSSAVEDASGVALVLAQASYWAAQPVERRPHRLVFVLQAGHMNAGAGGVAYTQRHRRELDDVVLHVHLEHAAREIVQRDRALAATGLAEPRWFFTSRIPPLEAAVFDALTAEGLDRSMLVAPDAFGAHPPTDGAQHYLEGVPVVQFLTAPFYLFDQMDTIDKVDREGLVPLTRAAIRIISSTRGTTAAGMRRADELRDR